VLLMRYRSLRDEPGPTPDGVCGFLGVEPGLIDTVPPDNVRPYVADNPVNSVLRFLLRTGGTIGHHFPVHLRNRARTPLLAALHRDHGRRPRVTTDQRAALIPRFRDDILRLQDVTGESYADWLSLEHASMYQ
jgi:hypothetical protein